jgi:4'-phosphopantetheinyl transferase
METISTFSELTALDGASIHVWGVEIARLLNRLEELRSFLCLTEMEKAARFRREADRQSSIAARGALRILLSGYMGIPAADIEFSYSENGKPHVQDSDINFSVSHSGEWVVLAIGKNRNVGVDVEMIRRGMDVMAIASRYFTPEECSLIENASDMHAVFFRLWARKEAYVKAAGSALFRELSSFSVPNGDGEKDGWHFRSLEAGSRYAAAVVTDREAANIPCFDFGGLMWDS